LNEPAQRNRRLGFVRACLRLPTRDQVDRANRRARKLRLRLGGDPADDEYPDKPPRMLWATYNRLMDRLVAADDVADERLKTAKAIVDQGLP
jgi:hypothetical protein